MRTGVGHAGRINEEQSFSGLVGHISRINEERYFLLRVGTRVGHARRIIEEYISYFSLIIIKKKRYND